MQRVRRIHNEYLGNARAAFRSRIFPDGTSTFRATSMNRTNADLARRTAVVVAIVAVAVLLGAVLWAASEVLMLIFAGILVACFLRGLANLISERTPLSAGWSLFLVVVLLCAILGTGAWFFMPHVATQAEDLSQGLQTSLARLQEQIERYSWGRNLLAQTPGMMELAQRINLVARVTGVFSTTLSLVANLVLVAFIGLYLAIAPGIYTRGLARLFPKNYRPRIEDLLADLGQTLRRWLVGRGLLMLVNGALTTLGLWLLGIPMAITLGVVAGLLNFVPNIGPIIAGIPAVLIGWSLGPMPALYVLLLYLALQSADGYIFTPLVQQRTVKLAPALTISAQILFGVLTGAMGVLLATPLTAAGVVIVRKLYLEDVLGETDRSRTK